MDLIYLPDSLSYQFHLSSYARNEKSWVDINEQTVDEKKERTNCSKDHRNCSICKQRQKRTLSTYIMKTRRDSDKDTFIEEEEEEEEENKTNQRPNEKDESNQREVKPTVVPAKSQSS